MELSRLEENKYAGDKGDASSCALSSVREWKQVDVLAVTFTFKKLTENRFLI